MEQLRLIWVQLSVASAMAAIVLFVSGASFVLIAPLAALMLAARGRPLPMIVIVSSATIIFALVTMSEGEPINLEQTVVFALVAISLLMTFSSHCGGVVKEPPQRSEFNGSLIDLAKEMWDRQTQRESKRSEELYFAQEKLSRANEAGMLAELTASIAHEVSQPLSALVSSSDASLRWLQADPPRVDKAKEALERVIRSADIATSVLSRIRALFRRNDDERIETSLPGVLSEARDLMAKEGCRREVHIDLVVEADVPPVQIDRVQIQQVVVNLIRNGFEAMEDTPDRSLSIRSFVAGNFVHVEIHDTRPGVKQLDQLFEPFFTTKGRGMGMGLSICRSIVEAHGGKLWVEPGLTGGTRFIFSIPVGGRTRTIV